MAQTKKYDFSKVADLDSLFTAPPKATAEDLKALERAAADPKYTDAKWNRGVYTK